MEVDTSTYKVGVVDELQLNGKLRICRVNIGSDDPITVVTSATNVRQGSRLAVATIGSKFIDEEGTTQTIRRQVVGGVASEGMFCDSFMLGWVGGAKGVAVQIPDEFDVGTAPPPSKPRRMDESTTDPIESSNTPGVGLFERKLTKEEKKKIAEERRNNRKARKNLGLSNEQGTEEGDS